MCISAHINICFSKHFELYLFGFLFSSLLVADQLFVIIWIRELAFENIFLPRHTTKRACHWYFEKPGFHGWLVRIWKSRRTQAQTLVSESLIRGSLNDTVQNKRIENVCWCKPEKMVIWTNKTTRGGGGETGYKLAGNTGGTHDGNEVIGAVHSGMHRGILGVLVEAGDQ